MPVTKEQVNSFFDVGLAIASKYIAPIALTAASLLTGPAGVAVSVGAALLPTLIGTAQGAMNGKTGDEKRAFVMGSLQLLAAGVGLSSTGGQKETWDKVSGILGTLNDNLVQAAKAHAAALATDPSEARQEAALP